MHNVSPAEVAQFDALAGRWWDPHGPMRVLHAMNGLRVEWIANHLPSPAVCLLDVGCGAGLAAEALAERGHPVLGLDAAANAIEAARTHAAGKNLPLHYRTGTVETLLADQMRFQAITALEVIEHVPDPAEFVRMLAGLLDPGARLFISTINRSLRSLAIAKIGAEYIARLLPPGTHRWRQFITPAELAAYGRQAGLRVADTVGMRFDPLRSRWRQTSDLSINYMVLLVKGDRA